MKRRSVLDYLTVQHKHSKGSNPESSKSILKKIWVRG